MTKQVILTGIRSNNDLHIGNYLGSLKPIIDLQKRYSNDFQINLFIPDLHSFTTPVDHSLLYKRSINNAKLFVAAGLDLENDNTYIYRQSFIPAHSELTVILNSFTYFGELSRMTQFKSKSENQKNVSVGLFDYPVLMAADILLYGAKYVPVGADQTQHVELTRNIALRFNNKFGDIFQLPEPEEKQAEFENSQARLRIRDLTDPRVKMSKSSESSKGVIYLSDTPEEARKKIMSSTTDSLNSINYNFESQPGISNLINILAAFSGSTTEKICAKYESHTRYGDLKTEVADFVCEFLADFQSNYKKVEENEVISKLENSETKMNQQAKETMYKVQKAVGLR